MSAGRPTCRVHACYNRTRRVNKREVGSGGRLFSSLLVLPKTECVLRSRYAVGKASIVAALSALL